MTLFRKIAVVGISAAVFAGSLLPAAAMPLRPAPVAVEAASDVVTVQYRYRRGYYNGHRGYRERRSGYRYHDGFWFPLAAFGAGALIGGAIASQPRYVEPEPLYVEPVPRYIEPAPSYVARDDINPRHYEWCADRYGSYDAYSNTFQPYGGPRQTCYSPYF